MGTDATSVIDKRNAVERGGGELDSLVAGKWFLDWQSRASWDRNVLGALATDGQSRRAAAQRGRRTRELLLVYKARGCVLRQLRREVAGRARCCTGVSTCCGLSAAAVAQPGTCPGVTTGPTVACCLRVQDTGTGRLIVRLSGDCWVHGSPHDVMSQHLD